MKRCFWLLNHVPTERQRKELVERFGMETIEFPPQEVSSFWEDISPTPDLDKGKMEKVAAWFAPMDSNDLAVVQGEMTASFALVSLLLKRGMTVLGSVTERHVRETRSGETIFRSYVFHHICFRRYQHLLEGE